MEAKESRFKFEAKKKFFHVRHKMPREVVAGSVYSQFGWGLEQPGEVEEVELDDF